MEACILCHKLLSSTVFASWDDVLMSKIRMATGSVVFMWCLVNQMLDKLADKFCDDMQEETEVLANVIVHTDPFAGFADGIWHCYRDTLCNASYYFSMDEMLILCHAAKVKVVIFMSSEEFLFVCWLKLF